MMNEVAIAPTQPRMKRPPAESLWPCRPDAVVALTAKAATMMAVHSAPRRIHSHRRALIPA